MECEVQSRYGPYKRSRTLNVAKDGAPLLLEYKRCAQICVAEAMLDTAVVDSMKAAIEADGFTLKDGAQRAAALPRSFRGFSAALSASLQP